MSCKSWQCAVCSVQRKAVAAELIQGGIRRARARGERVRFMTLTSPPEGLTLREVSEAWNRLMATLRPSGEISDYLVVIESGGEARPVPHLHALTVGKFIPQARLSALAERAGYGPICHITAVDEGQDGDAGAYMGKQLAGELVGYLAKGEAARLDADGDGDGDGEKRRQVRPVRLSRGF